jgi:threonine dehydratase
VVKAPFDQWFEILRTHEFPGMTGTFIHPVSDPDVMAGNGTIGLELLEQSSDFDTVVVPYGGGGLLTGIASAVKTFMAGPAKATAAPKASVASIRRRRFLRLWPTVSVPHSSSRLRTITKCSG